MKLAIDSSALVINRFSGLAEVVRNLIRAISQIDPASQMNLFINCFTSKPSAAEINFPGTVNQVLRFPRRLVDRWWNFGWPPFEFYLKGIDVFHSLHISVPPTKKMKTILTVHDCRYLAYPDLYSDYEVATYKRRMEASLRRVDMVCAVSEFTRQELLHLFTFPGDRIKVIHNGFTPIQGDNGNYEKKATEYLKMNNLPQLYLLHIGASDPRKNLHRLIEAMFQCREQYIDIPPLLVAGIKSQDWAKSDIRIRIEELGLSNHIHLCGVLEKDLLIGLTKKAYILCYPSLYEGFGFPPLEAMSLGVPVLAGRNTAIPEIVGNSACLVDPESVEDIARGLIKVVYDQDYRNSLTDSGYHQITKFSWEKAAIDYLDAYKEVLAS